MTEMHGRNGNGVTAPFPTGLEGAAVAWLGWCRDYRGRSPETVRSYTQTMDDLVVFLGGVDVTAVTAADVEAFIHRPRKRVTQAAPATINRDLAAVRSFYQWAVAHGIVDRSPAEVVHGPAQRKRQPRPIPDPVWVDWWQSDLSPSLRAALGLGFFGGLRRAEIVSLTRDNIQDRRIVNFVRKGGGEHTVPLDDMVDVLASKLPHVAVDVHLFWQALEDCRRPVRGRLVGWSCVDPQEVNRRILNHGRSRRLVRFTPHQLRHSAASNLVRTGMPLHLVSSLMNHSNIGITMGYVASGGEQLAEWKRGLT